MIIKRLRLVLIVLAIVVVGVWLVVSQIQATFERRMSDITISDVDLSTVIDGTYTGSCDIFPVVAVVKVSVVDHKIARIELVEHKNGQGAAAEVLPSKVVEAQTLQVDVITGATYSSRAILKAIENALSGGQK